MLNIYKMKLHDSIKGTPEIVRVPGGWIYVFQVSAVFVPFDNEFQGENDDK